ncbi:MAG: hypothetical protein WBD31_18710 [Rubripirellula sp.]
MNNRQSRTTVRNDNQQQLGTLELGTLELGTLELGTQQLGTQCPMVVLQRKPDR